MEKQRLVHGERETTCRNHKSKLKENDQKTKKKKKRFSEEQRKCLEEIFEKEKKLEPRRKREVARLLGLEPKQVAIWFQNKRARSKSYQLQTDFTSLRVNYDGLAREFQRALDEKQRLLSQLQKLRALTSEKQQLSRNHKSLPFVQDTEADREIGNRDSVNRTGIEPDGKAGSSEESTKTAECFGFVGNEDLLVHPEGYSSPWPDDWTQLLECLDPYY